MTCRIVRGGGEMKMAVNLEEFKDRVQKREIDGFKSYERLLTEIESLYNEEDFKFFYAKNLFNKKEVELYLFLDSGVINFKLNGDKREIKHIYGKPASKTLISQKLDGRDAVLTVTFNAEEKLILDAIEDSNEDYNEEYSKYIKELYKVL